jgi:pantothenate synthetase
MKTQRDIYFEQSRRQVAQWAERKVNGKNRPTFRHIAMTIVRSVFYLLTASIALFALLRLVGSVT